MKRIFNCLSLLLPFYSIVASANILVNAPPPAPQNAMGTTSTYLYFAASATGTNTFATANEYLNSTMGFQIINASQSNSTYTGGGLIFLDISTDQPPAITGNQVIMITLGTSAIVGDEIPLTGASVVDYSSPYIAPTLCTSTGSNCYEGTRGGTTTPYLSAAYQAGSVTRVSFALSDLCATQGVQTSVNTNICPADSNNFTSTTGGTTVLSQPIVVSFSAVDPSASPYAIGSLTATNATNTIYLTDVPPTIQLPSPTPADIEYYYAPGNQSVIFTADNYGPGIGTSSSNAPAPLMNLIVLADRTQTTPAISSNAMPSYEVSTTIGYTGSDQIATGFVNATAPCVADASQPSGYQCSNGYNAAIYSMNAAGIFSMSSANTPFITGQGDVSADGLLHAEQVNSVLTQSKCFIATAAFHDGNAGPVKMLRKFRDQILAKSSLGQSFIHEYYTYSPPLARWAWDKPIIRSIALHALAPVEFMAWAILKLAHSEEVSSQPYIDRVKKKLDQDNPPPPADESYTESVKKTLAPTPAENSESYIDRVKKNLPPEADPAAGYSEKAKQDLPPPEDSGSEIAKVQSGKDKRPEPKKPPITSAFSIKFGLSPGMKVTNTNGVVDFQQMYGNGSSWQPDLVLHYERQLEHSEEFGSFGIQADLGISYAEGYGQYEYGFGSTNTKVSLTKFSFVQLPITVGAIYRFNLFRVVRPYAGVAVGSMIYTEIPSDTTSNSYHGETPIYEGELGVSFLLDFLDHGTSKDGYLSAGIQHSYFFLEFMRMNTFATTGVLFQRSGIYAGVLFEY